MLEWVTLQEPQEAMSPPPPAPARNWDADHPVPIRMQRVPRVHVSKDGVEERAVLAGLFCVAALRVGGEESPVLPWDHPGSGTPTPTHPGPLLSLSNGPCHNAQPSPITTLLFTSLLHCRVMPRRPRQWVSRPSLLCPAQHPGHKV